MLADEGRPSEALGTEAVPLDERLLLAEALCEAEGPVAEEPPVTVVLAVEAPPPAEVPAEALSLGELLVEVLLVADTSPVGEVVFDPIDVTG